MDTYKIQKRCSTSDIPSSTSLYYIIFVGLWFLNTDYLETFTLKRNAANVNIFLSKSRHFRAFITVSLFS